MAVTANQLITARRPGNLRKISLGASERLYAGTIVFIGTDGYATATFGAGATFIGIAHEDYDNSSGSDGDVEGEVYTSGSFHLPYTGVAQTTVGTVAHATDNYTIAAAGGAPAGVIMDAVATNLCEIDIGTPRTLA
jgi:predicted RecA/RadA family phage recombinase